MKVGILTRYLAIGHDIDSGIGQHCRILADALTAQGNTVHVIYGASDPLTAEAALRQLAPPWTWQIVTAAVPAILQRVARSSWPLQTLLRDRSFAQASQAAVLESASMGMAVIETHSYGAPAAALLSARRRPRVITRVSTTARQVNAVTAIHSRVLRWTERAERRAIQRSDALLTHTLHHRDLVCSQEHLRPEQFEIVPHGIPDPGRPTQAAAAGADAPVQFLFVGRFERRKGIDVLLRAIPAVARDCPAARFTLAGSKADGILWTEFARAHPDLGDRVTAPGKVPPHILADLYRTCDVLVAPSRYESFGLIYPEAMAHGKPVIGCRTGGIPEVVQHDVTGLLAEPGDVSSLVAAMSALARDLEQRRRMGQAGRADFEARFSATRMAERSIAVYSRLLAS
jgi:glycosyltransferase involved in cell wall biosynthesis